MQRRKKILFLNLLLGLVCFVSFSFGVFASSPAFTFINLEKGAGSRIYFDDVKPGDMVSGVLKLSLLDDVPAIFQVVFNDNAARGLKKLNYSDADENSFFLVNWLNVEVDFPAFVEGMGSLEVPYTIKVPNDAIPGDYNGYFIASIDSFGEKAKDYISNSQQNRQSETAITGAKVNVGIAIEFILRVAGEVFPSVDFSNLSYFKDGETGKFVLSLDYKNSGNVAVIPRASLEIKDIFGKELFIGDYKFSLLNSLDYTTSSIKLSTKDFDMRTGVYDVKVNLYYDVFSRELGQNLVYVAGEAKMRIYYFPWYYFLMGFVVVFVVVLRLFYKNIRYYFLVNGAKAYKVKKGETLQEISTRYNVDPKQIIIVNRLSPPYFLSVNQKILIPIKKIKR